APETRSRDGGDPGHRVDRPGHEGGPGQERAGRLRRLHRQAAPLPRDVRRGRQALGEQGIVTRRDTGGVAEMTDDGATILIVDDELQNRKLLEVLLQPEGYETRS